MSTVYAGSYAANPWLMERPLPRHWVGLGLGALGPFCIIEPWHGMGALFSTVLGIPGGAA